MWNKIKNALFWIISLSLTLVIFFYINSIDFKEPSRFYNALIDGIISGIVTALIIFIFQILWKKNIVVWFENILYQEVHIEGEWSGFIVPYVGLKDIDDIQKEIAWKIFKSKMRQNNQLENNSEDDVNDENSQVVGQTTAKVFDNETGEEKEVSAEVTVHSTNQNTNNQTKDKKIKVNISPTPIFVKADFKRIGYKITGKIVEVGGASNIHTYDVNGSFKNLILTGTYESTNRNHIDRGSLSLMLLQNGQIFEGFFSSYGDDVNRIHPMKCILTKKSQLEQKN